MLFPAILPGVAVGVKLLPVLSDRTASSALLLASTWLVTATGKNSVRLPEITVAGV